MEDFHGNFIKNGALKWIFDLDLSTFIISLIVEEEIYITYNENSEHIQFYDK